MDSRSIDSEMPMLIKPSQLFFMKYEYLAELLHLFGLHLTYIKVFRFGIEHHVFPPQRMEVIDDERRFINVLH